MVSLKKKKTNFVFQMTSCRTGGPPKVSENTLQFWKLKAFSNMPLGIFLSHSGPKGIFLPSSTVDDQSENPSGFDRPLDSMNFCLDPFRRSRKPDSCKRIHSFQLIHDLDASFPSSPDGWLVGWLIKSRYDESESPVDSFVAPYPRQLLWQAST